MLTAPTATGRHYKRRRRIECLDFMNRIVKTHAGREIHVILDNLNTHTSPRRIVGLSVMPTCISTLRPPRRLGSIRSKSGAQSLPERRSQALLSLPSLNSKPTSKLLSTATTKPQSLSPGRDLKSIKNASNRVSRISDFGC